jgi:peptidoglycan hydrolase-like amidase
MKSSMTLVVSPNPALDPAALAELRRCAAPVSGAFLPQRCSSFEELLSLLPAHLSRSGVVFVAVAPESFRACKTRLFASLEGLKTTSAPAALALQSEPRPEDAVLPENAAVFLSADGLFNGFAMRSGKQHLLFLPLAAERLAHQSPGVIAYLRSLEGAGSALDAFFPEIAAGDHALCPIDASSILPWPPKEFPDAHTDYFAQSAVTARETPPPAAVPSAAEIHSFQQSCAVSAAAEKALRELLLRLAEQKERYALVFPTAWHGVADLIEALCGNDCFLPVLVGSPEEIADPETAVRVCEWFRKQEGCDFCGAVSAPLPTLDGGSLLSVAVTGSSDYAQVRQMELGAEESPGESGAQAALALLQLLCDYRVRSCQPPKRARLVALPQPDAADSRPKRRAVVASLLAAASVIACMAIALSGSSSFAANPGQEAPGSESAVIETLQTEPAARLGELLAGVAELLPAAKEMGLSTLAANEAPPVTYDATTAKSPLEAIVNLTRVVLQKLGAALAEFAKEAARAVTSTQRSESATTTTTGRVVTTTTTAAAENALFQFRVSGYGHGVGMSQNGAMVYADKGWSYEKILKHYYPGVTVKKDSAPPSRVTHDGVTYPTAEYLARIACEEIGYPGKVPEEAFRAQLICAYTIAKRNKFSTTESNQHITGAAEWREQAKYQAKSLALAAEVLGEYVDFGGKTANTLYFASSAGKTANAAYVWNSSSPESYLTGGRTSPETVQISNPSFTSAEIRAFVATYNAAQTSSAKRITLGSDPATWFGTPKTDSVGYVESIRVGDKTLTGGEVRSKLFTTKRLRSHCFTISFQAGK